MPQDPFSIFGLVPAFHIDEQELRKAFLRLQREWHPDYFAADPVKYAEALAQTAFINDAYKAIATFRDRIDTILKIKGIGIDKGNVLPQNFLLEMMDLNDQIDEALAAGNNKDHPDWQQADRSLTALTQDIEQHLSEITKQMDDARVDAADNRWSLVVEDYQKLKYLGRLHKNLNGIREV